MFSQALSKLVSVVVVLGLFHGAPAFASDPPKEEHGEAKKDEHGAEGDKSNVTEAQKKQLNEAQELQAKVQALQAKIKSKEDSITKLIEEKNHTKDAERVKDIIAEMVADHKEMSKMIVEYEQNRNLLRYRYPEKGYTGDRAYERMVVKPLDQMENQMSVEAKIKRNLKTVRSQYGEPAENKTRKKKSVQKKEAEAPSLTEPIVLQK